MLLSTDSDKGLDDEEEEECWESEDSEDGGLEEEEGDGWGKDSEDEGLEGKGLEEEVFEDKGEACLSSFSSWMVERSKSSSSLPSSGTRHSPILTLRLEDEELKEDR